MSGKKGGGRFPRPRRKIRVLSVAILFVPAAEKRAKIRDLAHRRKGPSVVARHPESDSEHIRERQSLTPVGWQERPFPVGG